MPGPSGPHLSLLGSVEDRKRDDAVKTTRERAEEKRQAKLELVREQVQNGELVIRQMTEEERLRYPPRTTSPKPPGRRY
jgi:hypothetical protein